MPPTVLERLAQTAAEHPQKALWSFLDGEAKVVDAYTYREADRVSTSLAAFLLHSVGLADGDRALLVFVPGLDFAVSLLACFKARIIAVVSTQHYSIPLHRSNCCLCV